MSALAQQLDTVAAPVASWLPDWTGETVLIVGGGPSARMVDIAPAIGRAKIIAINESHRLVPQADIVYGCDFAWWHKRRGLPNVSGLRVSQDRAACDMYPAIKRVFADRKRGRDVLVLDPRKPDHIVWGGNSGSQAINLAANLGAVVIAVLGLDFRIDKGLHWHGPHEGLTNPQQPHCDRWLKVTEGAYADLTARGVRCFNLSPISRLTQWPTVTLAEALHA